MADQTHSEETPAQKSLYDRLGGVYAIAAVIDDLIGPTGGKLRYPAISSNALPYWTLDADVRP